MDKKIVVFVGFVVDDPMFVEITYKDRRDFEDKYEKIKEAIKKAELKTSE